MIICNYFYQDDLARVGQEIDGSLVIFVMATYGEGDPTDNAQEFFDWLKETNDSLQGLKYTVLLILIILEASNFPWKPLYSVMFLTFIKTPCI